MSDAIPKIPSTLTSPNFHIGMKFGEFTLLRKVRPKKNTSANLKVRWKVRCSCGTELIVPEYYMKRKNSKTHCGCKNKSLKTKHNQEYRIWLMMHQRCYNENHVAYKHYGGRGIAIAPEWNRYSDRQTPDQAFANFLDHIGLRKSRKYSVDRINVDGNYAPGNVKWATAKEQAANKRPTK